MAYADFAYYTDTYHGNAVQEADFPRLALRASSFLDYYTQGRAAKHQDMEALKMACCALAEQIQTVENAEALAQKVITVALASSSSGGEIQSESVGSYTPFLRTRTMHCTPFSGQPIKIGISLCSLWPRELEREQGITSAPRNVQSSIKPLHIRALRAKPAVSIKVQVVRSYIITDCIGAIETMVTNCSRIAAPAANITEPVGRVLDVTTGA